MKNLLCLISLFEVAFASPARIQSVRVDRGQVQRIYLAPGMGSVVLFPCALQEVFVGRSEDLKAQISPNDKKTLFMNLKLNTSLPTNVIAKCTIEQTAFVFDVIPNRNLHQDLVEIRASFGRPAMAANSKLKQAESTSVRNIIVLKAPQLVKDGSGK